VTRDEVKRNRRKAQNRRAQLKRRRKQGIAPRARVQGVNGATPQRSAKGVSEAARAAFEEAQSGPSAGRKFVPGVFYYRPTWLRAFDRKRVVLDEDGMGWLPLNPEFVDPTREDLKFIPPEGKAGEAKM
jgi:hypothetical protein